MACSRQYLPYNILNSKMEKRTKVIVDLIRPKKLLNYRTDICVIILSILFLLPNIAISIEVNALNSIWTRLNLGQLCNNAGFSQCKFVLVNSEEENAYVTGDGNIYIHTALLRNVQSEDELAFIVAHEMAHSLYRHPQEKAQDVGWAMLGNTIAQLVVKNNNTKNLIDSVSSAITGFYSRPQEEQADTFAIKTIFNAGYNPILAANLFNRQLNKSRPIIAQWDIKKTEFENALYQSENNLAQKKARVNQLAIAVRQAEQIYKSSRTVNAYNQWVQFSNYYNSAVADFNNTVNYHNSLIKDYKHFIIQYVKVQSPLFRSHPLDEQRISNIINQTNYLVQQSK